MSRQTASPRPGSEVSGSRWSWLLPAGTFLVGCLLGAVVMGVGDVGTPEQPRPAASGEAADEGGDGATQDEPADGDEGSGEDDDVTVRVPASCVQAAEDASVLVDSVDRVVAAVADLDPRKLRQTVDDVQQVRDEVQEVAAQCRDIAAEDAPDTSGTDDEDAASATPSS